jgi:hypothetical protein
MRPRLLPVVGRRGSAMAAVIAASFDAYMAKTGHESWTATIGSALFMGVFTFVAFRVVARVRLGIKPDLASPEQHDPSEKPQAGGWANPTRSQGTLYRFTRLLPQKRGRRR